jgi:hypothetical protein
MTTMPGRQDKATIFTTVPSCQSFRQQSVKIRAPLSETTLRQGCQMVCFLTKNSNLGKFWRVLQWKMLVYFMSIWTILRPLEIFYGPLVYFKVIWFFPRFGMLYQEKSGNPALRG